MKRYPQIKLTSKDYERAPKWARFAGANSNGKWNWYSKKPLFQGKQINCFENGKDCNFKEFRPVNAPEIKHQGFYYKWEESLVKLPDHVVDMLKNKVTFAPPQVTATAQTEVEEDEV